MVEEKSVATVASFLRLAQKLQSSWDCFSSVFYPLKSGRQNPESKYIQNTAFVVGLTTATLGMNYSEETTFPRSQEEFFRIQISPLTVTLLMMVCY